MGFSDRWDRWGRWAAIGSLGLFGCSLNSGGFGEGSGGRPTGNDSNVDMTTMSSEDTEDPDDGVGSGDAGSTSTATTAVTNGSVDTTGPGPDDTTMGMDTNDSGPGEEEVVEHTGFGGCSEPLWCYVNPNVNVPAGGATWAQECFTTDMQPPFELVEFEFVLRGLAVPQVTNVALQVYERVPGGGPASAIEARPLDVPMLEYGLNTITLDDPITITTQDFCLGLAAPDPGLGGSLGVSVNPTSSLPNVSYIRLLGDGQCYLPGWQEVISLNPYPSGNWCIRGTIAK